MNLSALLWKQGAAQLIVTFQSNNRIADHAANIALSSQITESDFVATATSNNCMIKFNRCDQEFSSA